MKSIQMPKKEGEKKNPGTPRSEQQLYSERVHELPSSESGVNKLMCKKEIQGQARGDVLAPIAHKMM